MGAVQGEGAEKWTKNKLNDHRFNVSRASKFADGTELELMEITNSASMH